MADLSAERIQKPASTRQDFLVGTIPTNIRHPQTQTHQRLNACQVALEKRLIWNGGKEKKRRELSCAAVFLFFYFKFNDIEILLICYEP